MCGIIGCIRQEGEVAGDILAGLRRLEYRGYDSAGIAVASGGDGILIRKKLGRLDNLEQHLKDGADLPASRLGIGHTRWATHGSPSDRNAHPHRGCNDDLVVIHNGILENFLELKEELEAKGHQFSSETDSEVFAHLMEENLKEATAGDGGMSILGRAVAASVRKAKGSFGLVVLHRLHPDRIVTTRRDSPIVLGIGENAGYVGSDVPAFLPYTNRVLYLEDGEIAEVEAGSAKIFRVEDESAVDREEVTIQWSAEQTEKGGYPHFMLKEIYEQPDVFARTAFDRLNDQDGDIHFENFGWGDEELRNFEKMHLLACGTALHACLVGKFWLEEMARIPVEVDFASEYRYRNPILNDRILALAVSQSGETADTLGAIRTAGKGGAATLAICNNIGSSLVREVDQTILTHAGPEIGVASTKAFLAQLVAFYLFAIRLARARGTMTAAEGQAKIRDLRLMRGHLDTLLKEKTVKMVEEAARRFHRAKGFLFLGRGMNYPIALEGALKLKEISYVHAEGYPAGEMKHGPIALVDPDLPVLVVAPPGPVLEKVRSNMKEVQARGGKLVVFGDPTDTGLSRDGDFLLPLPEMPLDCTPMGSVIPLQLFAYFVADMRGCDIDKPRNLAKSVTVE